MSDCTSQRVRLGQTVLFCDAWVQLNAKLRGLRPLWLAYGTPSAATLRALIYVDAAGKVCLPRWSRFVPIDFYIPPSSRPAEGVRDWVKLAGELAHEMRDRRIAGDLALPPEVQDIRPWTWLGFPVRVGYTAYLDFPARPENRDSSVRKKVAQARTARYTVERTGSWDEILPCIRMTEVRKGFRYGVSSSDFQRAVKGLGDVARMYVCREPGGRVASARVILHHRDARAIDWLAGTDPNHLGRGATQYTIQYALEDISRDGAFGIDFAGANDAGIANAKLNWGASLRPYFVIEDRRAIRRLRKVASAARLASWRRTRLVRRWFSQFG